MARQVELPPARYDYGGDELVFVQLDRVMSLTGCFKALALAHELRDRSLPGVLEISPANTSCLIRISRDDIAPERLIAELKSIEQSLSETDEFQFRTRIIDVPVLYQDPWTHETSMAFRDRHPAPAETDLEFAARVTGHRSVDDFIATHSRSPYLVTMVGFTPGLPWCHQLLAADDQLDVPKYFRPRTETPERAVGQGGRFATIYPARGAGDHQLFGVASAPIYDPAQRLSDFKDAPALFRPGDLLKFRRIDHEEFLRDRTAVVDGTFSYRIQDIDIVPAEILRDPQRHHDQMLARLYGD